MHDQARHRGRVTTRRKLEQTKLVYEGMRSLSTVGNDNGFPACADFQNATQLCQQGRCLPVGVASPGYRWKFLRDNTDWRRPREGTVPAGVASPGYRWKFLRDNTDWRECCLPVRLWHGLQGHPKWQVDHRSEEHTSEL